jgi:hypothetical protein
MKRVLLGIVFALGLASTSAVAQSTDWIRGACTRCAVYSYVDFVTPYPTGLLIAGWGFECESGRAATRIDAWYEGDDGFFHQILPDYQWIGAVPRKDVERAFTPACPNLAERPYAGFHVWSEAKIPSGTRVIVVNVWREPYFQQHRRTVVIP